MAARLPLVYHGPTTIYGLVRYSRCRRVGRGPSGLVRIATADERRWLVAKQHVRPRSR